MAVPDFQRLMLPVLRAAADGEISAADLRALPPSHEQVPISSRAPRSILFTYDIIVTKQDNAYDDDDKGKCVHCRFCI